MQDLFERQRKILNFMGHKCNIDKSQHFQKYRCIAYIANLLVVISAQWPLMNCVIYNIGDLTLATASLSISFTNLLTVVKISTFLLYKRQIYKLMEQLSTMFEQLQETATKTALIAANTYAKKLVNVYFYSVCSTGLYFMISPLIKIIWAKLMQTTIARELPMPMRFPFELESTPGYVISYFYTGLVTLSVVMYAVSVDALFLSFTINLRAHFGALQHFIKSNDYFKPPAQLQHDLVSYVKYHVLVLELSKRVREIYKPIVFAQFLITSLQLCVIVYQLVTHMDNITVLVVYCTFLSSIMLQLFIYCYGGEIIKYESQMISNAIQLSDWYKLLPQHRRILYLMMMRSQREVVIKAGFYEASLANFMAISRAALSYITLIQSLD